MVDGEPPRDGLHCSDLRDAADEIARLHAEMARIEPAYEELRATVNRLSDERQCLRAEVALLRASLEEISDLSYRATSRRCTSEQ